MKWPHDYMTPQDYSEASKIIDGVRSRSWTEQAVAQTLAKLRIHAYTQGQFDAQHPLQIVKIR